MIKQVVFLILFYTHLTISAQSVVFEPVVGLRYAYFKIDSDIPSSSTLSNRVGSNVFYQLNVFYSFKSGIYAGLTGEAIDFQITIKSSNSSNDALIVQSMGTQYPVGVIFGYQISKRKFNISANGSLSGYCNTCGSRPDYFVFSQNKFRDKSSEYSFEIDRSTYYNRINYLVGLQLRVGYKFYKENSFFVETGFSQTLFENFKWHIVQTKEPGNAFENRYTIHGNPFVAKMALGLHIPIFKLKEK